jgi:hypothetical protein
MTSLLREELIIVKIQKCFIIYVLKFIVHLVALWLRQYATSRKVKGSRPDEVNEYRMIWGLIRLRNVTIVG